MIGIDRTEERTAGARTHAPRTAVRRLLAHIDHLLIDTPVSVDELDALIFNIGPDDQVLRLTAQAMRTRSGTEIIELLHTFTNAPETEARTVLRPVIDRVEEIFDGAPTAVREAWKALSVLDTPFTLKLATRLLSTMELPGSEALLADLVTEGIVSRIDEHPVRFVVRALYRTPSGVSRPQLSPKIQRAVRRGLLEWWTERCEAFTSLWFGPREVEEFDEIERDLPSLEFLVDTLSTSAPAGGDVTDDVAELMGVVCALWPFFTARNRSNQGLAWIAAIAPHAELDPATEFSKNWTIAWLALGNNDVPGSAEALELVRANTSREEARLAQVLGIRELYADNAAEAIVLLEHARVGHVSTGDSAAQSFITESHLAVAYWRANDTARAAELCASSLAISDASGEVWLRTFALWAAGLVAWGEGDRDTAYRVAMEGVRAAIGHGDKHVASLCLELLVWHQASEGHFERAAKLRGTVVSLERVYDVPVHFWGTSALGDEATTVLEERLGAARFADLVRQGEVHGIVDAVGWMDAAAANERPKSVQPPHGLTERQLQVADLIAEGRTNKEIAARLMVSVRAVEAHVERIFTRLGYSSRAQIAAWVARRSVSE